MILLREIKKDDSNHNDRVPMRRCTHLWKERIHA